MKGAAGAVAAATVAGQERMTQGDPQPTQPGPPIGWNALSDQVNRAKSLLDIDPLMSAKHAMLQRAQEEADQMNRAVQNCRSSLLRMKSVSPAYVEFQLNKLQKEQTQIWQRTEEVRRFIFG